jgi:hypothetical protein
MLDIPIVVNRSTSSVTIRPAWWKTVPQEEFHEFVIHWEIQGQGHPPRVSDEIPYYRRREPIPLSKLKKEEKWLIRQPEIVTETSRVMALPGQSKVLVCTKGIAVTSIFVQGMTGIVEAEDLDLVAARSEALHFNVGELRTKLIDQLKPQIIDSLNALSDDFIPNRFGFIANVGSLYGADVLLATTLPWIPTIDKQGNSTLMNSADVGGKLSQISEILISYKSHPWSATKVAREHFPAATRNALVFAISDAGQPDPGSFTDQDDVTTGELSEHFRTPPIFLQALLQIISNAWRVELGALETSKWSRNKTHNVNVHFDRDRLQRK